VSFPTTRRYPRSLAEAWPREHANPIEHYPEPGYRATVRAAVWLGCCICIGILIASAL
jgi:hypothetical protein